MSEPAARADRIDPVVAGVLHWHVDDERISFRSDAYAVLAPGGTVLIDPLPLTDSAVAGLGRVSAICLTGAFHQRSAWRYRARFGAPVHAPHGGRGYVELPDVEYGDGDALPGGLLALRRPGPTLPHFVFHLPRPDGHDVLFVADLLMRADGHEPLRFVSDEHQDDPARTRDSVRSLLELPAETVCPAHGPPVVGNALAAIRDALARDARPG